MPIHEINYTHHVQRCFSTSFEPVESKLIKLLSTAL